MKEDQECISSRWTLSARDRPSSSIINFQYIYFYRVTAETRHDDNISSFRWALVSCVLCSEKKRQSKKNWESQTGKLSLSAPKLCCCCFFCYHRGESSSQTAPSSTELNLPSPGKISFAIFSHFLNSVVLHPGVDSPLLLLDWEDTCVHLLGAAKAFLKLATGRHRDSPSGKGEIVYIVWLSLQSQLIQVQIRADLCD